MASRFLIGQRDGGQLWACIDANSLCILPAIGERRFQAYLSPYSDEAEARQALLEAGVDPQSIAYEIRPRRCRRG